MSNLTADQITAFTPGQPVRQVWSIKAPVLADHSAYTTTVIDDGIFPIVAGAKRRVLKAGKRRHFVINPHPQKDVETQAVRYSIEVDNADGLFHRKSGSVWNPFGIYDAAPAECFLIHQIYVWDAAAKSWSPIPHMDYIGRVMDAQSTGAAAMTKREVSAGVVTVQEAPRSVTITSEQVGAWEVLRRIFNKDDCNRTTGIGSVIVPNLVPTITTISPTSCAHNGAAFTLTVNGTNFSHNWALTNEMTGTFGGTNRTVTWVSSTQLTMAILAADVVTAGTRNVIVRAPTVSGDGGGASNTATFTVT